MSRARRASQLALSCAPSRIAIISSRLLDARKTFTLGIAFAFGRILVFCQRLRQFCLLGRGFA